MLPISMRTAVSCARLTQAFARFNLGGSRAYGAAAEPKVPPPKKGRSRKEVPSTQINLLNSMAWQLTGLLLLALLL